MAYEAYQELILDHSRRPRNFGILAVADVTASERNPRCGDDVTLYLRFGGGVVEDARFTGQGCAISQASASLLTERVRGSSLAAVRAIGEDDVLAMLGVPIGPSRRACASLALRALQTGLGRRS